MVFHCRVITHNVFQKSDGNDDLWAPQWSTEHQRVWNVRCRFELITQKGSLDHTEILEASSPNNRCSEPCREHLTPGRHSEGAVGRVTPLPEAPCSSPRGRPAAQPQSPWAPAGPPAALHRGTARGQSTFLCEKRTSFSAVVQRPLPVTQFAVTHLFDAVRRSVLSTRSSGVHLRLMFSVPLGRRSRFSFFFCFWGSACISTFHQRLISE